MGFSTSSGRPACAARMLSAGRWSVGAQITTACARRIAVSTLRTAAPPSTDGTAPGSSSQAATSRRSGSDARTPSTSGTCGCAQPSRATSIGTRSGVDRRPRDLVPGLLQRLQEDLGGLRARDAVLAPEDEERDAADADLGRRALVGAHRVRVALTVEHLADLLGREPRLHGEALQRVAVADRLALAEVRAHEPLHGRVAEPVLRSEVDEAVRVEGVAAARLGEVVGEAVLGGEGGDLGLPARGLLHRHAVLLGEPLGRLALGDGRRLGVELEAVPEDGDVVAVLEPCERCLEAALADVAPGAHDVRPDVDGELGHGQAAAEVCASSQVCCSACTRTSAGCAPDSPYLRPSTKNGTPRTPICLAASSSARTAAA